MHPEALSDSDDAMHMQPGLPVDTGPREPGRKPARSSSVRTTRRIFLLAAQPPVGNPVAFFGTLASRMGAKLEGRLLHLLALARSAPADVGACAAGHLGRVLIRQQELRSHAAGIGAVGQ